MEHQQLPAQVESPERSSSSSSHAPSTETRGTQSETHFHSSARRGCLAAVLVKGLKTFEQDERQVEAEFAAWGGAGVRERRKEDPRLPKASQTPD